MKDPLPKFASFPAPRSGAVWAAPMPLPARGGPGLGVRVDEQVLLMTLQPRAERIERYVPEETAAVSTIHPFKVRKGTGDNIFTVRAGTCEGQLIETQDVYVGATRPVAILAYPQYALTIFNSEYVSAGAVKTGDDAPVLTTSTSVLEDVIYVTAAGNEARALIAVIFDGDVIAQIAMGNIVSVRENYGLSGVMSLDFNKSA